MVLNVYRFYEWKKDGNKKQPYYIHFDDGRPLVFAALFDCWIDSKGTAHAQAIFFVKHWNADGHRDQA